MPIHRERRGWEKLIFPENKKHVVVRNNSAIISIIDLVFRSDSQELKVNYFQSLSDFLILPKEHATGAVLTCTGEGNGGILK